ncbi:hypothetical protein AAMO2058_000577700 [Amorphochlora amoebiformis]
MMSVSGRWNGLRRHQRDEYVTSEISRRRPNMPFTGRGRRAPMGGRRKFSRGGRRGRPVIASNGRNFRPNYHPQRGMHPQRSAAPWTVRGNNGRKRRRGPLERSHPPRRMPRSHAPSGPTSIKANLESDALDDLFSQISSPVGPAAIKPKRERKTSLISLANPAADQAHRLKSKEVYVPRKQPTKRRQLTISANQVESHLKEMPPQHLLWSADCKIRDHTSIPKIYLRYMSKGEPVKRLPMLSGDLKLIRSTPADENFVYLPKHFDIDLNDSWHVPFTRYMLKNCRRAFCIDFDLTSGSSSSNTGEPSSSSFGRLDSEKVRIAETMTSFIVGNYAFRANKTAVGRSHKQDYEVFIVPEFIVEGDVESDMSFASGVMNAYMEDYLKLNTEWSYANPDLKEQMKSGVTGLRFKAFVVPERLLQNFAENWYQGTLSERKLHLILDVDKTLIKAFQENQLHTITKLKKDAHLNRRKAMPSQRKASDGLPVELADTESFKIEFQYNQKKKELWIKPRPYLKEFLTEVSKDFEISLLSMGVPQYLAQVVQGISKICPMIKKSIPPHRVLSSAYTMGKARKGNKDLRMLYPFCRFGNRRNTVAIVDDTTEVWGGRENFCDLVYPISRYEGLESYEVFSDTESSLRKCLEKLKVLKAKFFQDAEELAKGKNIDVNQALREVYVAKLWPDILNSKEESKDSTRKS